MQPIDKPFRFTLDFCLVWALLAVPTFFLTRHSDFVSPWYSYAGVLILLPLFAAFVLYGPVLLVQQIFQSGSYGWFVFRVFVSIVLVATLLLVGLYFSGFYTQWRARLLAFVFTAAATVYLSWRTEQKRRAPNTALEPTAAAPSVSGEPNNPTVAGQSTSASGGGGSALDL